MRRVLALFALVPALALAKAPASEAELVADRPLPDAPAVGEGRVTCTAVVVVDDEGRTRDVGVAAGDTCQGAWAKSARRAISRWRWPSAAAAEGAKGHVTVAWDATQAASARVETVPGLEVLQRRAAVWPAGLKGGKHDKVVCRAMVGVTAAGTPQVVAVDACPTEFQTAAADALFGWRWKARDDGGPLVRTWVLVSFGS